MEAEHYAKMVQDRVDAINTLVQDRLAVLMKDKKNARNHYLAERARIETENQVRTLLGLHTDSRGKRRPRLCIAGAM